MKLHKKIFFCALLSWLSMSAYCQTQVGADINGLVNGSGFGTSVSTMSNGNMVAIGSPFENGINGNESGVARVYAFALGNWAPVGAPIQGENDGDHFGSDVAIIEGQGGFSLIVGAPDHDLIGTPTLNDCGRVYVYDLNTITGVWELRGNKVIDGEEANQAFGSAVGISGNRNSVVIGASQSAGLGIGTLFGKTYLFDWSSGAGEWELIVEVGGSSAGDQLGTSVAISADGSTFITGGPKSTNSTTPGEVFAYQWNGTLWQPKGGNIVGQNAEDLFGSAVSISQDGNCIVIGAPNNDLGGNNAGSVSVYKYKPLFGVWQQEGNTINSSEASALLGNSVSINGTGDKLAIGAKGSSVNGNNSGQTHLYQWDDINSAWEACGFPIDGNAEDFAGTDVSISSDGERVVIGLPGNNEAGGPTSPAGRAQVFCVPVMNSYESATACDSYVWNQTTYNQSGLYNWVGTAANACDSVVFLDLTIETVNVSTTENNNMITANYVGGTYQWLDCNNNYAVIPGETSQSFTPSENGSYAVEITGGGANCVDTSACVAISTIGLHELSNTKLKVYPNPTKDKITIELDEFEGEINVTVISMIGEKIIERRCTNSPTKLELTLPVEQGIYMLMITDNELQTLAPVRIIKL